MFLFQKQLIFQTTLLMAIALLAYADNSQTSTSLSSISFFQAYQNQVHNYFLLSIHILCIYRRSLLHFCMLDIPDLDQHFIAFIQIGHADMHDTFLASDQWQYFCIRIQFNIIPFLIPFSDCIS